MDERSTTSSSSAALAHRRGKSSLSSTGSGAVRSRIGYPNAIPTVSPSFQASRLPGPGASGHRTEPEGILNRINGTAGGVANMTYGPSSSASNSYPLTPSQVDPGQSSNAHLSYGSSAPHLNSKGGLNGSSSSSSNGNGAHRSRPRRPDTEEIKRVAHVHYEELYKFLKSHLAKGQRGPRTNAREKLTRLSQQQFTELSTDVYDELMRRVTNARTGSEIPHLAVREEFHPKRNQARQKLATLPRTRFKDLSSDVFFELERRFPELRDEFRPEVSERERREEEEAAQRQRQRQNSILSNRDEEIGSSTVLPAPLENEADARAPQPSTADVVIPAKSTLVEEQIALPYAQTILSETDFHETPTSSYENKGERGSPLSGEKRASIRDSIVTNDQENNRSTMYSQASSVGTGFYNGYAGSRATESVASPNLARASEQADGFATLEVEKLKSDYEFRIATLQQKLSLLHAQNTELEKEHNGRLTGLREEIEQKSTLHESKVKLLESSLAGVEEQHSSTKQELVITLAQLNDLQSRHKALEDSQSNHKRSTSIEQDLNDIRQEYHEQESLVAELRSEVASLVEELRQLSLRNDELLSDKDSDQSVIKDLNGQVASYRRKYENAKTELRTLKATSQLFVQPPKTDDFMPPSESGAIADINLTAFQSSIDDLLAAARSKTPSNVLLAMKTVVLAATLITDDVGVYEQRQGDADGNESDKEEREQVAQVKSRISNTLNNLMTACRNHASSHGLSPVSLLDAASSHVSASIVDVVKLVKVRKATKEETEGFEATFTQNGTLPNGLRPLLGASALASHGGQPRTIDRCLARI